MPKTVLVRQSRDPKLVKRNVPICIGKSKEPVYVLEDLLCLNSPYFRRRLQPKRKSLEDEANRDCSICTEDMDHDRHSLKTCISCGTSFHATCVDKWHRKQRPRKPDCPFCRAEWHMPKPNPSPFKFPDLSEVGYSVYHDWLLRKHFYIDDFEQNRHFLPDYESWLEAYFTGNKVEDNKFCHVLCHALLEFVKGRGKYPNLAHMHDVYNKTSSGAPSRGFFVGMYARLKKDTFAADIDLIKSPTEFLVDMFKHGSHPDAKPIAEWDVEKIKEEICLTSTTSSHLHPRMFPIPSSTQSDMYH